MDLKKRTDRVLESFHKYCENKDCDRICPSDVNERCFAEYVAKVYEKEELYGGIHHKDGDSFKRPSGAVLQPFRNLRRLQVAATALRDAAGGQTAAGLRPARKDRASGCS